VPYYNSAVNALRTALYAVHAWVTLCLVILVYRVDYTTVSGYTMIHEIGL